MNRPIADRSKLLSPHRAGSYILTINENASVITLALSTKELDTLWRARSQNNGLGWDISVYPWGGVSVG